MRKSLLALLAIVATGAATNSAIAFGCGEFGYGFIYSGLENRVPYFAAHPPVYYSYPVPRTYGFSPFAYPPNVMTPEIIPGGQPQTIVNPYVPSSSQQPVSKPQQDKSVSAPTKQDKLVIVNPFATPRGTVVSMKR